MSLRFRRQLRLLPGLHLNLSRSGISATVGVPGMRVTLGRRPAVNVGLPGSGVSYRESLSSTPPATSAAAPPRSHHVHWLWIVLPILIGTWVVQMRASVH